MSAHYDIKMMLPPAATIITSLGIRALSKFIYTKQNSIVFHRDTIKELLNERESQLVSPN